MFAGNPSAAAASAGECVAGAGDGIYAAAKTGCALIIATGAGDIACAQRIFVA